jgi:hypothetical protein
MPKRRIANGIEMHWIEETDSVFNSLVILKSYLVFYKFLL